jgi:hypothetical protein
VRTTVSDSLSEGFTGTTDHDDYKPGEPAVFAPYECRWGSNSRTYGIADDPYTYDHAGTAIVWAAADVRRPNYSTG